MEPHTPEPTSKPTNSVPVIVGSVLIAALVVGGGVYAYEKNQNNTAQADLRSQIDSLNNRLAVSPAPASPTHAALATPLASTIPSAIATSSPAAISSSLSTATWKTYTNKQYGYSVKYPTDWVVQELSNGSGAGFRPSNLQNDAITIGQVQRSDNYSSIPFEKYVQQAAVDEIQNYKSLNTITQIKGSVGAVGYRTTWNTLTLHGEKEVSAPITYFLALGSNTGATDEIYLKDTSFLNEYEAVLGTYKYANEQ